MTKLESLLLSALKRLAGGQMCDDNSKYEVAKKSQSASHTLT
jgi:hypothetical protein